MSENAANRRDGRLLHLHLADAIEDITLALGENIHHIAPQVAVGLLEAPIFDDIVARRLEVYARDPMFVRDIAEAVANTNLDTMHLEDANVAYAAAADTLAAVVGALKEEARKQ